MTRKLFGMVLCAVLSVVAFGQNATTSVRGNVTDPTGAFVQGATVTLTKRRRRSARTQTVGKNGDYNFVELQPAAYTISVAACRFWNAESASRIAGKPTCDNQLQTDGRIRRPRQSK